MDAPKALGHYVNLRMDAPRALGHYVNLRMDAPRALGHYVNSRMDAPRALGHYVNLRTFRIGYANCARVVRNPEAQREMCENVARGASGNALARLKPKSAMFAKGTDSKTVSPGPSFIFTRLDR